MKITIEISAETAETIKKTLEDETKEEKMSDILKSWANFSKAGIWEINDGVNTAIYENILEGLENCLFHALNRTWKIKFLNPPQKKGNN